ncbi:hypothetical protein TNCV_1737111 [Trichonephila clavipes]|nr:hypothetical protein TNCV_1737111 [Trichonephila clavipes]
MRGRGNGQVVKYILQRICLPYWQNLFAVGKPEWNDPRTVSAICSSEPKRVLKGRDLAIVPTTEVLEKYDTKYIKGILPCSPVEDVLLCCQDVSDVT